jgi:hypothetical protein
LASKEAEDFLNYLAQNPREYAKVNWDKFQADEPSVPVDKVRYDLSKMWVDTIRPQDVTVFGKGMGLEWINAAAHHVWEFSRHLTRVPPALGEKILPQLKRGEEYKVPLISTPMGTIGPDERGRILYNLGLGAAKLPLAIPQFFQEVAGAIADVPSNVWDRLHARGGQPGDSQEFKAVRLAKSFVDSTAKFAALVKSRMDNRGRPMSSVEQRFYDDITQDPFAVLNPLLVVAGGPSMVRKGIRAYESFKGAKAPPVETAPVTEPQGRVPRDIDRLRVELERTQAQLIGRQELEAGIRATRVAPQEVQIAREIQARGRRFRRAQQIIQAEKAIPQQAILESPAGPQVKAATVAEADLNLEMPKGRDRQPIYKQVREFEKKLGQQKVDNFQVRQRVLASRKARMGTDDLRTASDQALAGYISHLQEKLKVSTTQPGLGIEGAPPRPEIAAGEGIRTPGAPERAASENNATFNGMQERPNKAPAYMFTDNITHSSVMVETPEALPGQLAELRARFAAKPTPSMMEELRLIARSNPEILDAARKADLARVNREMSKPVSSPEEVARNELPEGSPLAGAPQEYLPGQVNLFESPKAKNRRLTAQETVKEIEKAPEELDIFGGQSGRVLIDRDLFRYLGERALVMARTGFGFGRPSRILFRHEAGREGITRSMVSFTAYKALRNSAEAIVDDATKHLNAKDKAWIRENGARAYEAGLQMPNDRIGAFFQAWRESSDLIARAARSVGVKYLGGGEFGVRRNYFPHWLTEGARLAMESKGGPVFEAIVAALEKKGMTTEGIRLFLNDISPEREAMTIKRAGSLEHPRLLQLPTEVRVHGRIIKVLQTDPLEVIPSYIERSSRRLGVIHGFGQGNEVIENLIKRAGDNLEIRGALQGLWSDLQRTNVAPGFQTRIIYRRVIRPVENIMRGPLLSMAQVSNIPGYIAIAYKVGLKNTVRGFLESFDKRHFAEFEMDRRLGAWSTDIMRDLQTTEDLSGTSGRMTKRVLRGVGFEAINEHINRVAARGMQYTIEDILAKYRSDKHGVIAKILGEDRAGILRRLREDFLWSDEHINKIVDQGLSEADRARVAQRGPSLVNVMGESPLDRPSWMRHPLAQMVLAYTSFARAMGNILMDSFRETRHGNFKPLATFLFGQVMAGELSIWLKNLLYNRERADKDWADRLENDLMASMTFGIGGIFWEKFGYARRQYRYGGDASLAEEFTPPNVGALLELAGEVTKAYEKGELPQGAAAAFFSRIPLLRAGLRTGERIMAPESAAKKRRERTKAILGKEYGLEYFEARQSGDLGKALRIRRQAREHGAPVSIQSFKARRAAARKRKRQNFDIYKLLGSK